MLPTEKGIFPPEGGWKPHTYYAVDVAFRISNPVHRSLLYSGFLDDTGNPAGYGQIINPSYDHSEPIGKAYFVRVIAELGERNTIGDPKIG